MCQVQRKLVNAHGLARLSIRAMIDEEEETAAQDHSSSAAAAVRSTAATASSSTSLTHQTNNDSSSSNSSHRRQRRRRPCRLVEGWISQYLNPMSGQGGPVVQPIPFCVPALYRVTLPSGAVVRQEIEL